MVEEERGRDVNKIFSVKKRKTGENWEARGRERVKRRTEKATP